MNFPYHPPFKPSGLEVFIINLDSTRCGLEFRRLSSYPREELSADLEFATKTIRHKYANVYETFCDSFLKREKKGEISYIKLATVVKDFIDFEKKYAKSEDLLLAVRNRASYWNFDAVLAIIRNCGTEEDKELAKTYEEEFWLYARRRIFEIDIKIQGDELIGHETLVFVLDEEQVIKVFKFKNNLCTILGIKKEKIIIRKLGEGCIVVYFQVPIKYMTLFYTLPLYRDRISSLKKWHIQSYDLGDGMIPLNWELFNSIEVSDTSIVSANNGSAKILPATIGGSKCLALKHKGSYSDEETVDFGFIKYLNSFLSGTYKDSFPTVQGVYYSEPSEGKHHYPTIVIENLKTLKEVSPEHEITLVSQISVLSAVASFKCDRRLQVLPLSDSILIQESSSTHKTARFCPLYGHSFHFNISDSQEEKTSSSSSLSLKELQWMIDVMQLIHLRGNVQNENDTIPKNHTLKKLFDQKWLSCDDRFRPPDFNTLSEELKHLLETEKTFVALVASFTDDELEEESQIHFILIGHTGVGKTCLRKNLKNEPIDMNQAPTIVMEPEFLYRECIDINRLTDRVPFKNLYKESAQDSSKKVYLTLWDTGGQPIFQDLLPCFARLKCMYGIVFRLSDLAKFDDRPDIRPFNKSKIETSPFTNKDIVYRNLAYVQAFSCNLQDKLSNLQLPEQQSQHYDGKQTDGNYPAAVVVGTHSDMITQSNKQLITDKKKELDCDIKKFAQEYKATVYPVYHGGDSYIHEVDNTSSGDVGIVDQGIGFLRNNISQCAQQSNTKIPKSWKLFEKKLQRLCYTSHVNIGIISLEEAIAIGKEVSDPKAALMYFHEQGTFMWYHLSHKESMNKFVVIAPKLLLEVLSKVLCYNSATLPDDIKSLIKKGLVTVNFFQTLLQKKASDIDNAWFVSFLEEHHLTVKVFPYGPNKTCYFLPSLLPIEPEYDQNLASEGISPLYIVPRSGYIATGLFTRLLTALAGVSYGSTMWRIPITDNKLKEVCRNQFEFVVSGTVYIQLTEFSKFIRIDCLPYQDKVLKDTDFYSSILSTLNVQLQRIIPHWIEDREFDFSVSCMNKDCYGHSNHFLLPNQSFNFNQEVECIKGRKSFITPLQLMWFSNEATPNSDLIEKFLEGGSLDITISSILFTGVNYSDCVNAKHVVFQEPITPSPIQRQSHEIYFRPQGHPGFKKIQQDNYIEAILYSAIHEDLSHL